MSPLLTPRERRLPRLTQEAVVVMHYLNSRGVSQERLAKAHRVAVSTVRSRLFEYRRSLAKVGT